MGEPESIGGYTNTPGATPANNGNFPVNVEHNPMRFPPVDHGTDVPLPSFPGAGGGLGRE